MSSSSHSPSKDLDSSRLDPIEKSTLRRHQFGGIFENMLASICWSSSEIATKAFQTDHKILLVTLITMAPSLAQFSSIFMASWIERTGRRRLLRVFAIVGRLPLLSIYWISGPWSFLLLVFFQSIAMAGVSTTFNSLLRTNYRDQHRGKLFGKGALPGALAGSGILVLSGMWLNNDPTAYHYLYPLAGISGAIACFIFAEIDLRRTEGQAGVTPEKGPSIKELWKLLVNDRFFFRYELGFLFYGLAFMALITAKPLLFAEETQLNFSYNILLGGKGLFGVMMVLATIPMGKVMDRVGPAGLAARCYPLLALYSLILYMTHSEWLYLVSEAVFGLSMAGVLIAWNMGPVAFAPGSGLAARYMLIHVALVGVRGAVGHPLGGIVSEQTGNPRIVFLGSVVFFVIASWIMWRLSQDIKNKELT